MATDEHKKKLLAICQRFITEKNLSVAALQDVVDDVIPDRTSPEWQAWTTHMGSLSDVYQRREEGEDVPWPAPPVTIASPTNPPTGSTLPLDGFALRESLRLERKLAHDGGNGSIGPVRAPKTLEQKRLGGRRRDEIVDDLILEFDEVKSNGKTSKTVYCIACEHHKVGRDAARIKDHAKSCNKLATKFPKYYAKLMAHLAGKSNSSALANDEPQHFPAVRKATTKPVAPTNASTDLPLRKPGGILEHFGTTKISDKEQAALDLLLLKVFICCALPWALLDNRFFRDFIAALAMNYVIPDRSAFFVKHIAQESAHVAAKLKEFLLDKFHLTLSFDGWSSRGKDEIYTFHITTPSRRSLFAEGHVLNGLSVTGLALLERAISVMNITGATKFSAVTGDGGPNVRSGKIQIHATYPWILNIYDPCHNLNLYMKDLGKLFSDVLVRVSGISNYFGKSNYGTAQLETERKKMNIPTGMKSASETRFSSTYTQARAVQTCMPAIKSCLREKTLVFNTKPTKKLLPYLEDGEEHYKFMGKLSAFVKLLSSGANGILTLEGQNTTCADVFYVWVTIAYHLEQVLAAPSSGLVLLRKKIITVYNQRFNQMMTESSHHLFLLSYFLHPLFRYHGGLKLNLPLLRHGEKLEKKQYPPLLITLLKSALNILHDEQLRSNNGGREESDALVLQIIAYCYNREPFASKIWDATTKPLEFWSTLMTDSNAQQLARVAVKLFSIAPSEICDERTASRLGWFNAARRSSMTPEHLIDSVKLYDFWTHGFNDGEYTHKAHVHLPPIDKTSSESAPLHYSAPSLMDLLNEETIAPKDVDISVLEETLFDHPDPYDLAECDRVDEALQTPAVVREQDTFDIAQYVKLDSAALETLMKHMSDGSPLPVTSGATEFRPTVPKGKPSDWDMDDYF